MHSILCCSKVTYSFSDIHIRMITESFEYLHSLPYNWKTPAAYFFTFSIQIVNFFFGITLSIIFLTFFAGICQFATAFAKDTQDSLREINVEISTLPSPTPLLHRVILREKLCVVMRFQADSRELSQFNIIIQTNLVWISYLFFRFINEFSEFYRVYITWFFLICGIFISSQLFQFNMVSLNFEYS